MNIETVQERARAHGREQEDLEVLLTPYWLALRDKLHKDRGFTYPRLAERPDYTEFAETGVVFHQTYNDACECHPEWVDAAIECPYGLLSKTPEKMVEGLKKEEMQAEAEKLRKDLETADLKRRSKIASDLSLYLRLRARYSKEERDKQEHPKALAKTEAASANVEGIYRLLSASEDDPEEPLKLLEIIDTGGQGQEIVPMSLQACPPHRPVPFVLVETTLDEFRGILEGRIYLPKQWMVGDCLFSRGKETAPGDRDPATGMP